MKKWFKRMAVFIAVSLLLILATPGQVTGTSCTCYKLSDAKNACWTQEEYRSSTVLSGTCQGPSCYAYVKVICLDLDEEKLHPKDPDNYYPRYIYSWGDNCAVCGGSGGGGGGDGAGFDDIPGDYGNWHDPNWR
ncbi:MAG: hypothetical protein L0Y73_09410 [Candidatus Aminicenantes bacterium]|nr:hypothetical protein [Candidatus Aminicenantes bacterium]